MPYGLSPKVGGDSKDNDSWMEKCVSGISGTNKRTGKPYSKGEKIAICKAQLDKNKSKSSILDDEAKVEDDVIAGFLQYRDTYIRKMMSALKISEETAVSMFDVNLARNNFDYRLAQSNFKF